MTETTMEFGVDLTCMKCVNKTTEVLKNRSDVTEFKVELKQQRVVVTSVLPSEDIKALIETTGKRAVLLGLGTESTAAVAMLGGLIGGSGGKCADNVVGIVR